MELKIGTKLGLVFGFLILMLIMMSCFGLSSTRKVNESLEEIAGGSYAKTLYAVQAAKALDNIQSSIRMIVLVKEGHAIEDEKRKIDGYRANYKEAMTKLEETEKTEQGRILLESAKSAIASAKVVNNRVMELALAQ